MTVAEREKSGWLLLIHQIPPKPNYFRVKIWRRLQKLGAVAIKNSVYALPSTDQAVEDLNWVLREIVEGGGDASLVEARLIEGLDDEQVKDMFRAARDADYHAIANDARGLARQLPRKGELDEDKRSELAAGLARLQKRVGEVAALDFLHARGREAVEGLLQELEDKVAARVPRMDGAAARSAEKPHGATWVTRTGIHVDRMASAWLIRRFIDPRARFKFVSSREHRHQSGELRFDMFEGDYTHDGDRCTFETLLKRFTLEKDTALRAIGEMVHDVDCKEKKFGRDETAGFARLISGIVKRNARDEARIARGVELLDTLYESFPVSQQRSRSH